MQRNDTNILVGDNTHSKFNKILEDIPISILKSKFNTIARINKNLKANPSVEKLIYFGNMRERIEEKIDKGSVSTFLENYNLAYNSFRKYILKFVPSLSRYFFKSYKEKITLNKSIKIKKTKFSTTEVSNYKEATLKLYALEVNELIKIAHSKKIDLLFITTPLNLKKVIPKTCYPLDHQSQNYLQKVKRLARDGKLENAYALSKSLLIKNKFNTDILYFHALIADKLNYKKEALRSYKSLSTSSCDVYFPDLSYNYVLRKLAKLHKIKILDLSEEVFNQYLSGVEMDFVEIIHSNPIKSKFQNTIKEFIEN